MLLVVYNIINDEPLIKLENDDNKPKVILVCNPIIGYFVKETFLTGLKNVYQPEKASCSISNKIQTIHPKNPYRDDGVRLIVQLMLYAPLLLDIKIY